MNMQSATRGILYCLSFILLIFGAIDLAEQFKAGEELRWRVPLIFIGFGLGLPLFLSFSPDMFSSENSGPFGSSSDDDYGSFGDGGGDGGD